ncbi:MAG: family 10 glycosylhydrolase [Bacteroidia bacterium]|nr:family 10 glycosylhydrolase [Bacteroidia bacterium]
MKKNLCTAIIFISILINCFFSGCNSTKTSVEEIRAVWLHPGLFNKDHDTALIQMSDLFESYKETGINNLFCYNTLRTQNGFEWDYLQVLINEGHKRGIKIHPIFYPGYDVRIEGEIKEHPEWLIRNIDSTVMPNLNLTLPAVRAYWLRKISDALKYDIDGIHLDYTRFPIDQKYSYDSITIAAFKKESGVSPLEISPDCGNLYWCEWIQWNTDQITLLVSEIRKLLDKTGKDLLLGVDAFPDIETSRILIGQDWTRWAEEGLVDILCPMLYTNDTVLLSKYLNAIIDAVGSDCTVCPGIGIVTAENKITKELLVNEIKIVRNAGARGMAFFSGYSFSEEFRDTLKRTVFSK